MDALYVFRVRPDGSFDWLGSAGSMQAAHEIIRFCKVDYPLDAFLIHDAQRNNTVTVHAEELPLGLTISICQN